MLTLLLSKIKNQIVRGIIKISPITTNDIEVKIFGRTYTLQQYYPYGMKARPPINTKCINLFVGGESTNGISLPYVQQFNANTPALNPGEVMLFNPLSGASVTFLDDGSINFVGNVTINGNVIATGNISDLNGVKGSLDDLRTEYETHVHYTDGSPGFTGLPENPPQEEL
jgi:phage gp45-like